MIAELKNLQATWKQSCKWMHTGTKLLARFLQVSRFTCKNLASLSIRKLCLQNPDNNVLQNDYKAQCKVIWNLIKQKLRHYYQNKIEKEAAHSKRKFFNLFNETSGRTLTTHHNKQIVENIETFNTFFANIGVELAKAFDTKQKYEIEILASSESACKILAFLRVLSSLITREGIFKRQI